MKYYYLFFLALIMLFGCNKLVEPNQPIDQITTGLVFSSDASANLAITGLYNRMVAENCNISSGGMTLYCGMAADEFRNTQPGSDDEFSENSLSLSNSVLQYNFWTSSYSLIYQANGIIEGLEKSNAVSNQLRTQIDGEAKLVRGLLYFNLVNIFGEVPLILSTEFSKNSNLGRSPIDSLYSAIIEDVQNGTVQLPEISPAGNNTRPTKWAASALLSRIYLYRKNWGGAIALSTSVINNPEFQLENDLNAVFLPTSKETIWQFQPGPSPINTWEGNRFIPGTGSVPNYALDSALVSSFHPSDLRKSSWIGEVVIGQDVFKFPFKYKKFGGIDPEEYYIILRLAEQYLIRAEAYADEGDIANSKADIDFIRQRAGLDPSAASTIEQLKSEIIEERRKELFAEWGHRWLDLKRWGKASEVLSLLKPGWQSFDELFPIPMDEIKKNPLLSQNPGY